MRVYFRFVLLFQGVAIIQFAAVKRSKYDDYTFPLWADVVGWLFVGFEVALIPAVAIYKVMTMKTDLPILDVSLSDETATLSNTQQSFTIMIITQLVGLKAPLHGTIRPHGACRLPCTWANRSV